MRVPLNVTRAEDVKGIVFSQGAPGENQLFVDAVEVRPADSPNWDAQPQLLEASGLERHVELRWANVTDPGVRSVFIERDGQLVGTQ